MTGYFCCRSSMAELDEKSIPRRILRQGMYRIGGIWLYTQVSD